MLRSLILKNFQKHSDLEVQFDAGTTIITGANWSGKSTIIRGVLYALFGPSVVPGGSKILQKRGVKGKPFADLAFSLENTEYRVTRRAGSAALFKNGQKIATGANVVTGEVEDLLGYPSKLFAALRVAPQEEAASILTLGSAKLNEILNTITQVDVIDRVLEEIGVRRIQVKTKISGHQDIDLDSANRDLEEKCQFLMTLHTTINSYLDQYQRVSSHRNKLEEEMKQVQDMRTKAEESNKQKARLSGTLEALEKQKSNIHDELTQLRSSGESRNHEDIYHLYIDAQNRAQQVKEVFEKHAKDLDLLGKDLAWRKHAVTLAEDNLSAAEALPYPGKEPDIEAFRLSQRQIQEQLASCNAVVKQTYDAAQSSFCPTCQREFDDITASREELEKVYQEALRKQEIVANNYADISQQLKEAESLNKLVTEKKRALEHANIELEKAVQVCEAAQNSFDKEKTKTVESPEPYVEKMNALLDEYQVAHRLFTATTKAERDLQNLQKEIGRFRAHIENIPSFPENLVEKEEEIRQIYTAVSQKESDLKVELHTYQERYSSNYKAYQEQVDAFNVLQDEENSQKKERQLEKNLTTLNKYLIKNRDNFTEKVWNSLLLYASQFVNQATGGAVTAVSRDSSGNFTYQEAGEDMPIQAASGLQKAIIGTAVRLALAEAVRASSSFFLLDEVTAGASDEASMAVTTALNQTGLQIVTVTHRPADAAVADKVISL